MLTADQLAVIKATVPVLQEHGETLTRHFYQRMFEHNPEVRPYFNPAHQRSAHRKAAEHRGNLGLRIGQRRDQREDRRSGGNAHRRATVSRAACGMHIERV